MGGIYCKFRESDIQYELLNAEGPPRDSSLESLETMASSISGWNKISVDDTEALLQPSPPKETFLMKRLKAPERCSANTSQAHNEQKEPVKGNTVELPKPRLADSELGKCLVVRKFHQAVPNKTVQDTKEPAAKKQEGKPFACKCKKL